MGIINYLCIIIEAYGENICKKHLEKLLGKASGFGTIPDDLVRYGNEFKLEFTK